MVGDWVLVEKLAGVDSFRFWRGADAEEQALKKAQSKQSQGLKRKQTDSNSKSNQSELRPRLRPRHGYRPDDLEADDDGDNGEQEDAISNPEIALFGEANAEDDLDEEDRQVADILELIETTEHDRDLNIDIDEHEELFPEPEDQEMPKAPASSSGAASSGAQPPNLEEPNEDSLVAEPPKPHVFHAKEPAAKHSGHKKTNKDVSVSYSLFGDLRYNIKSASFYAECKVHEDCRKTRSASAAVRLTSRSAGQGRPLGLLAAWLERSGEFDTANDHKGAISTINLADRQDARRNLATLPHSEDLFNHERPKREGEEDEPKHIP